MRLPAVTTEQLTPNLRLVHRLRSGQPAELVEKIKECEANNCGDHQCATHPDRGATRLDGVDRALYCIGTTGHSDENPKSKYRIPKQIRNSDSLGASFGF